MRRLKMKKSNMILTKRLPKYQHYNQVKMINVDILQSRIMKQAKFVYSLLGNALEKQKKAIEDKEEKQIKETESRVKN